MAEMLVYCLDCDFELQKDLALWNIFPGALLYLQIKRILSEFSYSWTILHFSMLPELHCKN